MSRIRLAIALALAPVVAGCGNDTATHSTGAATSDLTLTIPYVAEPFPDVLTAGQPTEAQLEALKRKGFVTIVNLRTWWEMTGWERRCAERLKLRYVAIPVGGAGDLTLENARALSRGLEDPTSLPVLVHCRRSDRVGALFAVKAFLLDGKTTQEALTIGKRAGLSDYEPDVRALLDSRTPVPYRPRTERPPDDPVAD